MKLSRPTLKLRRPSIGKIKLVPIFSIIAVLILGASLVFWWKEVRNNPERIFWGMINNSLQTKSITRSVAKNTDTNQPEQFFQYVVSPAQYVHGSNRYFQSGDTQEPTLITEVIGTPDADYLQIKDLKQTMPGKPAPDTSNVRNVWANADTDGAGGQLFSQSSLNLVPIGSLKPDDRAALIAQMQRDHVYDTNFAKAIKTKHDGRSVYVYNIDLKTMEYVKALKTFADKTGLKALQDLNPDDYKQAGSVKIQIAVDVLSKQLLSVHQLSNDDTTDYVSHGLQTPVVTAPAKTIPLLELQKRLQALN